MRYYFIRYEATADNYEGFFYDTFNYSYKYSPTQALCRYLSSLMKKHDITINDIDVITFNRI